VVLQQADRFAEHGAADRLPLDQLRLGADQLTWLEALGDDPHRDAARHRLGPLGVAALAQHDLVAKQLARRTAAPEVLGFGLEVLAHATTGEP